MEKKLSACLEKTSIHFYLIKTVGMRGVLLLCMIFGIITQSDAQTWLPTVERYLTESESNPPSPGSTFFMGSSTWTQWGTTLEEDFVDYEAVNRGFGGSIIPDQLAYMDQLMMPYKPGRILFFCGTNDLLRNSPDSVFQDFKTFLGRLWVVHPETQVYFVSVPHAPSREKHWDKGDTLNSMVEELAATDDGLIFVDIVQEMYDETGRVREELYKSDRLHMNRKGQEIWIPKLQKAMDENPITKRSRKDQKKLYEKRQQAGIF